MILDNATLHHNTKDPEPEDQFETAFTKAAKAPAEIKRGKFGRFAHDKVFIVTRGKDEDKQAVKVLTGSTNFSVTGLYVNSNHVLVFNNATVAQTYADVFEASWQANVQEKAFLKNPIATKIFPFSSAGIPKMEITFSPHPEKEATLNLDNVVARMDTEQKQKNGSIFFAVMGLKTGTGPVLPALSKLHADDKIFTYGISDTPDGIFVYTPRKKTGALVSGKPTKTKLPPPFDQVPQIGLGHQIHHKFIVCGFNGKNPVVYCGSSNLALGGEEQNGDNLIAIHDPDIATVFTLEALALVDHFDFLDRSATVAKEPATKVKKASKQEQAASAGWFLSTTDGWVAKYYDPNDLKFVDRNLFG
jgi:phosphatidylserine/phosphatidylglycerophosphate/cardiolipin synthase-like enzyme